MGIKITFYGKKIMSNLNQVHFCYYIYTQINLYISRGYEAQVKLTIKCQIFHLEILYKTNDLLNNLL